MGLVDRLVLAAGSVVVAGWSLFAQTPDFSRKPPVLPVSPIEEARRFWLPPGFDMTPVLSEPAIQEPAPAAAPAPTATTGVSMILEFEQDSWTEVSADGARVFSGLIRRGSKHQFDAREGFRLTLGNAGGVRVTVDGRAMEPLGTAGQVVRDMPVPGKRLTQS